MQVLIFLILLVTGGWFMYDHHEMSKEVEAKDAKIAELQKAAEDSQKQTQLALAELNKVDPTKALAMAKRIDANAGVQANAPGSAQKILPPKKNWLQERIDKEGSSLKSPTMVPAAPTPGRR